MASITVSVEKEVEVVTLKVQAGVRYWEDATINGVEDTEGTLTPFRVGDVWCPSIDIETGVVANWPAGTVANIDFKVCDDGRYQLCDASGAVVKEINGYVPDIMCPEGDGYGDYIIMKIDGNGKIDKWKVDLLKFATEEE